MDFPYDPIFGGVIRGFCKVLLMCLLPLGPGREDSVTAKGIIK